MGPRGLRPLMPPAAVEDLSCTRVVLLLKSKQLQLFGFAMMQHRIREEPVPVRMQPGRLFF